MGEKRDFEKVDAVSDRIIGWGALVSAAIEIVSPAVLAIDLAMAGGLASFGFLLATGRAKAIIRSIKRGLGDE